MLKFSLKQEQITWTTTLIASAAPSLRFAHGGGISDLFPYFFAQLYTTKFRISVSNIYVAWYSGNLVQLVKFVFQESSGTTLMDLITSDGSSSKPSPAPSTTAPPLIDSGAPAGPPVPAAAERKSKKGTLMQIQSDTISAAKAAFNPVRANIMPQRQKKKVLFFFFEVCACLVFLPRWIRQLLFFYFTWSWDLLWNELGIDSVDVVIFELDKGLLIYLELLLHFLVMYAFCCFLIRRGTQDCISFASIMCSDWIDLHSLLSSYAYAIAESLFLFFHYIMPQVSSFWFFYLVVTASVLRPTCKEHSWASSHIRSSILLFAVIYLFIYLSYVSGGFQ